MIFFQNYILRLTVRPLLNSKLRITTDPVVRYELVSKMQRLTRFPMNAMGRYAMYGSRRERRWNRYPINMTVVVKITIVRSIMNQISNLLRNLVQELSHGLFRFKLSSSAIGSQTEMRMTKRHDRRYSKKLMIRIPRYGMRKKMLSRSCRRCFLSRKRIICGLRKGILSLRSALTIRMPFPVNEVCVLIFSFN